jgi:hypothetical protein
MLDQLRLQVGWSDKLLGSRFEIFHQTHIHRLLNHLGCGFQLSLRPGAALGCIKILDFKDGTLPPLADTTWKDMIESRETLDNPRGLLEFIGGLLLRRFGSFLRLLFNLFLECYGRG